MSAVAVYSAVSPGTNLVTFTSGMTRGDFEASEKAFGTVVRTAISRAREESSLGLTAFSAISRGALPLRKPSTLTSLTRRARAFLVASARSDLSRVTLISILVSDNFFTVLFMRVLYHNRGVDGSAEMVGGGAWVGTEFDVRGEDMVGVESVFDGLEEFFLGGVEVSVGDKGFQAAFGAAASKRAIVHF